MPDTAVAADPVAAVRTSLTAHEETCASCSDSDAMPCAPSIPLRGALRRAIMAAALDHAPLNHAPATGQTREVPVER